MKKQLFLCFFSEICDLSMFFDGKILYLQPNIIMPKIW